jgi:rRNA small subunit pseudouridine methyltransferase Nep1
VIFGVVGKEMKRTREATEKPANKSNRDSSKRSKVVENNEIVVKPSSQKDEESDDEIYDPFLHKKALASSSCFATMGPGEILVILDLASLEIVKTKKGDFQLLNCDDHIGLIRKFHKDPSDYRPDIIHQELMAVLDSPLNKLNKIKVIVHTEKNVLFEVNPKTRIPRTFKRFSGLMVQLLHKLKIRSADGQDMLLKVIKNPISSHLPPGAHIIGFSHHGTLQSPANFAKSLPTDKPIVLVFGAQATRGIISEDHPYIQDLASISQFPLSGIVAINRVLGAIEETWGVA